MVYAGATPSSYLECSSHDMRRTLDLMFATPGLSYDWLRRICLRMGERRGYEDPEGLYHEALMRVGRTQQPGSIHSTTLVVQAFLHAAIDRSRRKNARKRSGSVSLDALMSDEATSFDPQASQDSDPAYRVETADLHAYALLELGALPRREGDIFRAWYVEERNQNEIAGQFGLTVSGVQKILRRTGEKMRRKMRRVA
ncbi:sigma-70 family RNA polymerase sigma factor [Candidatus Woesearchaeota archaeon]|nr:sigma-70 family RNA polymerase sigma factor [Candidatus Woesearchaeota archaeon]